MAKNERRKFIIQAVATLIQNANFRGFFTGKIYQGPGKNICVPGLNCYSCPGAVGACPLGSLQGFLSGLKVKVPYYVVGLLLFAGALLGRAVCAFLCPFGLLQDLINLIPFPWKKKTFRLDKPLRYLKYVVLAATVLLPLFIKLVPFFCKYLCPGGTVAGILLAISDKAIASKLGPLFTWKAVILILIILTAIVIYRPFCKYLCPLGAFYSFFNRISILALSCDKTKCTSCGKCSDVCKMGVNPSETIGSPECILCRSCVSACPHKALR